MTDTGGILSHCAIVAREYGIPAVVGVGGATAAIRDGQTVEVDGDAGVVRIVGRVRACTIAARARSVEEFRFARCAGDLGLPLERHAVL